MKRILRMIVLMVVVTLVAAACAGDDGADETTVTAAASTTTAADVVAAASCDPDAALAELEDTVLSTGPAGEEPVSASTLELSDDERAQVAAMDATAAIVMHYGGNDWSQAQIDGLQTTFADLGIEVVAVTDANFAADQQVTDIETVLVLGPDIIVSIPTDPTATANAYKQAADDGVLIVFMDNVADGMVQGEDYVSVVSADNYGNGAVSAHLMAKALDCEGTVGVVYHAADFFVTRQRYDAFLATIGTEYPGIEIIAEQGIGGPDFSGDAEKAASAMLTTNPDLDGIWAVWDVPAEGVLSAARIAGREDLIVTTIDLGENVAISIANGGPVFGLGAQRPFDQGVAEAILAAYGLLGKEAPPYVALNALPVTVDNLDDAWRTVYHADPPDTFSK